MKRQASLETLRRLAEAADRLAGVRTGAAILDDELFKDTLQQLFAQVRDYRAETAPLRTRAEVDANIVAAVRAYCTSYPNGPLITSDAIRGLCREETAHDPTELGTCPPGCSECATLGPPIDASFPEPCSCDESAALYARLQRIHQLTLTYEPNSREGAVDCIRAIRKASE